MTTKEIANEFNSLVNKKWWNLFTIVKVWGYPFIFFKTSFILPYDVTVSIGDSKSLRSGSNPDGATIMYYFKYNNKVYEVPNLEKKLKRMKLTLADIELIDKPVKVDNGNEDNGITKHHFVLPNGYTVTSIYDNLDNLGITNYKQID